MIGDSIFVGTSLAGSALEHRSLPSEFESRGWRARRVFHLRLRFVAFEGCSTHLACHVRKIGHKTLIIIIIDCIRMSIKQHLNYCHYSLLKLLFDFSNYWVNYQIMFKIKYIYSLV